MHIHVSVHTCSDNAYKTYMSAMYNFTMKIKSQKLPRIGFELKTMCMPERRLIH
jgi:hypothetical protein